MNRTVRFADVLLLLFVFLPLLAVAIVFTIFVGVAACIVVTLGAVVSVGLTTEWNRLLWWRR